MQHPAKGPGQGGGGGCCSLTEERSSCLERSCFALPFTKGNAREANSAARCHMDTKCSPLAHSSPLCTGEGSWSRFHPACPELPQLLQPHLSQEPGLCWAAHRLQTGGPGAGGSRDLWATPEQKPFPAPAPLSPFPSSLQWLFVWDHHFGTSQELKSVAKISPSPLPPKG